MAEPASRPEIMQWRKSERQRLIDARRTIGARDRYQHADTIADRIASLLDARPPGTISFYWPIRAEPNLLPLLHRLGEAGWRTALPVVVEKGTPLAFRAWRDGEPLVPGVWNIPIPAQGEDVTPDVVTAPVVGFDSACYRLGYGGGFFDRTLAALSPRPLAIGIGYELAAIPTIHPLPHDIPLDMIVTERAVHRPAES